MNQLITVKVNSPERVIWEGPAKWVSSINSDGPFDILPFHANFITIIENKPIRVKTQDQIIEYVFPYSIVYAHNNLVNIYTNLTTQK